MDIQRSSVATIKGLLIKMSHCYELNIPNNRYLYFYTLSNGLRVRKLTDKNDKVHCSSL